MEEEEEEEEKEIKRRKGSKGNQMQHAPRNRKDGLAMAPHASTACAQTHTFAFLKGGELAKPEGRNERRRSKKTCQDEERAKATMSSTTFPSGESRTRERTREEREERKPRLRRRP